jgi:putative hydrolase of the HAD superfamily
MPYHVTWAHEADASVDEGHPRLARVAVPAEIPAALAQLEARAPG